MGGQQSMVRTTNVRLTWPTSITANEINEHLGQHDPDRNNSSIRKLTQYQNNLEWQNEI